MSRESLQVMLRNLAALVFAALPLCLLLVWAVALIRDVPEARSIPKSLETGAFYWVSLVAPVALGGVAHQFALLAVPHAWRDHARRYTGVLLVVLVPLVVALLGQSITVMTWFWAPIVISLAVYAMLMRLPMSRS